MPGQAALKKEEKASIIFQTLIRTSLAKKEKKEGEMCLVKVREEPDLVVPYRVVHGHHHRGHSPGRRSSARISRTVIEERPASHTHVVTPGALAIPAPQPVPVFVQPPPPPPPPPAAHYVHVSPHSSSSSISGSDVRSDYVYRREVRREREVDSRPRNSGAYGERYETYRYVDAPREEEAGYYRSRSRSSVGSERRRRRSVSRRRYVEEEDGGVDRVRTTKIVVEDNGSRRREYHR